MLRIRSVVVNVRDLGRGVAFWGPALGYQVLRDDGASDWVTLGPPDGRGSPLSLQLTDRAPEEVPHLHLDLDVVGDASMGTAVERLLGLGASRVDWPHYEGGDDFVVLADPDGNRFCVIDPDA